MVARERILVAALALALGFCSDSAWAHATLAAWNGFSGVTDGATQHGVSLHLEGNTVNGDGSITIGSRGLWLSRSCGSVANATSGAEMGVTVIAEVSDVPVPTSGIGGLLSIPIIGIAETWAGVDQNGKVTISWNNNDPKARSSGALGTGTHIIALGYKNRKGSTVIVDGVEVVTSGDYSAAGMLQSQIHIGEHKTYSSPEVTGVLTGMKVLKLAVINDRLTAAEVADYCATGIGRPNATQQSDYARLQADFSDRVFTWRSTVTSMGNATSCKFGRFNLTTGEDGDVVGSNEQIVMPGYEAPVMDIAYRGFSSAYVPATYHGYSTPGLVLRFPVYGGDYSTSCMAQFPLTLGGLLVEEGAYGGVNDSTATRSPITLTTDQSNRTTDLGDMSGNVPCWFVLHEDVVLNRKGQTKIWGVANFAVDAGRKFDCTSDNASAVVTLQAGASLVCHGKGSFKVRTLTATADGVCLDWSNLEVDNAHPFIDGNLQICASTRLVFPAEAKEVKRFALCSGSLTGEFPAIVQVGDETVENFLVVNNTIVFSSTTEFTGEGEVNWSSASAWSHGVPQAGDIARIPCGRTVVVSASDDLSNVSITGDGRVIYVTCLPGSERSGYCESSWTGTVEIRPPRRCCSPSTDRLHPR